MKKTFLAAMAGMFVLGATPAMANSLTVTESPKGLVFSNKYRQVIVGDMIPEIKALPARARTQVLCIAINNMFEGDSRTPSWEELRELSSVVLVRAEDRYKGDSSPCSVVWRIDHEPDGTPLAQFGWTNDRLAPKTFHAAYPRWVLAQRVAYTMFIDKDARPIQRRNSFCNVKIDKSAATGKLPEWCAKGEHAKQVNQHRIVRAETPAR